MPKQKELFLTRKYEIAAVAFNNADGVNPKLIITAGADDSRITSISIANTSASTLDILLYLNNGTTNFLLGHVDIPGGSGFNGTANQVSGLNRTNLPALEINSTGSPFLPLEAGWSLHGAMKSTIASPGVITVIAIAEEF